jgi:hypothetical protein
MATKPQQDLSLLPGGYYHPEAVLDDGLDLYTGLPKWRGHWLHGLRHGIWEFYRSDGTLIQRTSWLYHKVHGYDERYDEEGTLESKSLYLYDREYFIHFFIEFLLNHPILDI